MFATMRSHRVFARPAVIEASERRVERLIQFEGEDHEDTDANVIRCRRRTYAHLAQGFAACRSWCAVLDLPKMRIDYGEHD